AAAARRLTMIELVIRQRTRDLGSFEVGRVLPFAKRRMLAPYIFFDRMGPKLIEAGLPREAAVRPHPHIGLSTITYLFDGEIMHRDSVGSSQPVRPGEVNWMTAGRGITHSERFERARREGGGPLDGIQAWVALPDEHEECEPSFDHIGLDGVPRIDDAGVQGRLIAGRAFGLESKVPVYSPLFYIQWTLDAGARVAMPEGATESAAYVASGRVEVNGTGVGAGSMPVFRPGSRPVITALEPSVVMAL